MCRLLTNTEICHVSAGAIALALCHLVCAQRVSDLMWDDPRLGAAYHFAEFAGGYKNIKVDLLAHKVVFTTVGGEKEWNCEGGFTRKEGSQQSRCYLRQPNAAISLAYESTVVVKNGSTAVSLQSGEDGLRYGNGVAAISLLPKWLPEVPPSATLESARVLYSIGGYETVDVVLKPEGACISHYARTLGVRAVNANELRWSDSKNGSRIDISAVTVGEMCQIIGKRAPIQAR